MQYPVRPKPQLPEAVTSDVLREAAILNWAHPPAVLSAADKAWGGEVVSAFSVATGNNPTVSNNGRGTGRRTATPATLDHKASIILFKAARKQLGVTARAADLIQYPSVANPVPSGTLPMIDNSLPEGSERFRTYGRRPHQIISVENLICY